MTKIAFVSADWTKERPPTPGGSGWARVHVPGRALADLGGHEVAVGASVGVQPNGALIPLNYLDEPLMMDPEVVVVQRWMHRDAADHIRRARALGQVVINDVDDNFLQLDPRNRAHAATAPSRNPEVNRNHYRAAVAASDLVTCSTPYLARRYQERLGVQTVVVPNAIDLLTFPRQEVRDLTEGLVVGWVGATPWRSGDLETVAGVLGPWLERRGARFVHHGAQHGKDYTAYEWLGVPDGCRVRPPRPMTTAYDYPTLMAGFDIGIAPLNPVPFNAGKSAIKAMEYAAAGIPYVASDSPAYREYDPARAAAPKDWPGMLDRLLDPAYRRLVADEQYERVRREDIRVRWRDWERVYQDTLARRVA